MVFLFSCVFSSFFFFFFFFNDTATTEIYTLSLHDALPIFGTCAGLILLAREVESPSQFSLGLVDVAVERNAYGRQKESFEATGAADLGDGRAPLKMVFIRAPRIRRLGPGVTPLAWHQDECVMARQGSVLVAAFHPELTDETIVHGFFAGMVRSSSGRLVAKSSPGTTRAPAPAR